MLACGLLLQLLPRLLYALLWLLLQPLLQLRGEAHQAAAAAAVVQMLMLCAAAGRLLMPWHLVDWQAAAVVPAPAGAALTQLSEPPACEVGLAVLTTQPSSTFQRHANTCNTLCASCQLAKCAPCKVCTMHAVVVGQAHVQLGVSPAVLPVDAAAVGAVPAAQAVACVAAAAAAAGLVAAGRRTWKCSARRLGAASHQAAASEAGNNNGVACGLGGL